MSTNSLSVEVTEILSESITSFKLDLGLFLQISTGLILFISGRVNSLHLLHWQPTVLSHSFESSESESSSIGGLGFQAYSYF